MLRTSPAKRTTRTSGKMCSASTFFSSWMFVLVLLWVLVPYFREMRPGVIDLLTGLAAGALVGGIGISLLVIPFMMLALVGSGGDRERFRVSGRYRSARIVSALTGFTAILLTYGTSDLICSTYRLGWPWCGSTTGALVVALFAYGSISYYLILRWYRALPD